MGVFGSIGRGITGTVKSCVNVKGWIGYDNIKSQTIMLSGLIKAIFFHKQQKIVETKDFDTVLKQMNVTEEDLKKRAAMYLRRSIVFFCVGILGLIYMIYIFLVKKYLLAGIVMLLISIVLFLQAYSMNLYYIQIKRRKLGLSFKEWLSSLVSGGS